MHVLRLALCAGTTALALAGAANAQVETAARADAPAPGSPAPGSEVIVTAQKRSEAVRDVPASVAVLGGGALRLQAADKLEDYVARVPGLVLNAQAPGQSQVTIRGVSTGSQGAPTVSVYIDEAPVGVSTGDGGSGLLTPDVDSIDLQRIEVLRGPQGTLYGASNIGGLLKYVTVSPDPAHLQGEVGAEGEWAAHGEGGYALRGRVNVPIAGQAALLLSAYHREDPGFVDDAGRRLSDLDGRTVTGLRLSFLWTPTAALSIRATAMGQDRKQDGFTEADLDPSTLAPLYGQYQQRRAVGAEYARNHWRLYDLTASYDFGWATLTETTAYSTVRYRGSEDYTQQFAPFFGGAVPDFGAAAAFVIDEEKLSQEVRLSGDVASRLGWIVGVFYTHEDTDTEIGFPVFNATTGAPIAFPSLLNASAISHYNEYAGFGELTWHVSPRLDLIGGFRYAWNDEHSSATTSGLLAGGGPPSTTLSSSSDNSPTFTVSPRYRLTDHLTAYARVASGYRPGGANAGYAPLPAFSPDKVVNYEAGLKGDFPVQRASFELSGFYVDWRDVQLQLRNPQGLTYIGNAGAASSAGFEAAGSWSPVSGLILAATAAYTDAHLTRDIPPGPSFGLSGDRLPFAPRFKGTASADYDFALAQGWTGFVGATLLYTGAQLGGFTPAAAVPRARLPDYTTVDLRAGVRSGRATLEVFVRNVGDEVGYNGYRALTGSSAGATAYSMIQPRVVGVSLRASL